MSNSSHLSATHRIFHLIWWTSNFLLLLALFASIGTGVWEDSVRKYLRGFSDAIVPEAATPVDKVEAILTWMRNGPPRFEVTRPADVSARDPQDTLNYRQLLAVCGSAMNAFLNCDGARAWKLVDCFFLHPTAAPNTLSRKLNLDGRWVVADPTYRVIPRDAKGSFLTRRDLQNPEIFEQVTSGIPNYAKAYNYDNFAHVRVSALPFQGFQIANASTVPSWLG